jgi:hypothetical protein
VDSFLVVDNFGKVTKSVRVASFPRDAMSYHPTTVSSLIMRGLIDQVDMEDVEDQLRTQFPEIDRHTLWESYNIALFAVTLGGDAELS